MRGALLAFHCDPLLPRFISLFFSIFWRNRLSNFPPKTMAQAISINLSQSPKLNLAPNPLTLLFSVIDFEEMEIGSPTYNLRAHYENWSSQRRYCFLPLPKRCFAWGAGSCGSSHLAGASLFAVKPSVVYWRLCRLNVLSRPNSWCNLPANPARLIGVGQQIPTNSRKGRSLCFVSFGLSRTQSTSKEQVNCFPNITERHKRNNNNGGSILFNIEARPLGAGLRAEQLATNWVKQNAWLFHIGSHDTQTIGNRVEEVFISLASRLAEVARLQCRASKFRARISGGSRKGALPLPMSAFRFSRPQQT